LTRTLKQVDNKANMTGISISRPGNSTIRFKEENANHVKEV